MSIQNSDEEVITVANEWLTQGHSVSLVTVVRTWGSSPRPVGSIAAVRDDGELVGSVSGGCVEKQLAENIIRNKSAKQNASSADSSVSGGQIETYHVDDDQARRYGLACGGELALVFEQLQHATTLTRLTESINKRESVVRTLDTVSGDITYEPFSRQPDGNNDTALFSYDDRTVKKVFGPGWRLLIIGSGQLSRYTAEFALALDYEVIVCEPRPGFKEAWSVNGVTLIDVSPDDAVLEYATDAKSAVLALTHDPNVDDLALLEALPSKAFYVGALGSMRNYEKRKQRLAGLGLEANEIDRLVGPVGLDIDSRTSAEIAVSIIADLIKTRRAIATS